MGNKTCKRCLKIQSLENFREGLSKRGIVFRRNICKTCTNFDRKKWHEANPEKAKLTQAKTYVKNQKRIKAYWKQRYPLIKLKRQKSERIRKYGMSDEIFIDLLLKQDNKCAICKNPETVKNRGKVKQLAVDHNHKSGNNRGLLCQRCNVGIGNLLFDEGPHLLIEALQYYKKYFVEINT